MRKRTMSDQEMLIQSQFMGSDPMDFSHTGFMPFDRQALSALRPSTRPDGIKVHMKRETTTTIKRALPLVLGLALAGGCATPKKVESTHYFYPPPPNEPRLQFLTGFSSEKAFRGGEDKSLMTYLTGTKPVDKELGKPYGAAASGKKLFVCDTAIGAVVVMDLQTRRFGVLEAQGEGALKLPLNVTADKSGMLYVSDTGRDQVVIFDKDGHYVDALGKAGEMKPRDVAVNEDRIYVADLLKHNVRVYDKATRKPILEIPHEGDRTNRTRGLFTPTNLALDSKGRLYVSDTGAFRIQVYDAQGDYVRSVGEMGDGQGQFARVKGIAIDRQDRLYAADAMSQVVQVFDDEGKLLTWFGEPGADNKIQNLPAKVLVDYDDVGCFGSYIAPNFKVENLVMVVNQIGPHKVSVYGFGQKK
jgi:DNA-binding beta-propeller fold protein YncE